MRSNPSTHIPKADVTDDPRIPTFTHARHLSFNRRNTSRSVEISVAILRSRFCEVSAPEPAKAISLSAIGGRPLGRASVRAPAGISTMRLPITIPSDLDNHQDD